LRIISPIVSGKYQILAIGENRKYYRLTGERYCTYILVQAMYGRHKARSISGVGWEMHDNATDATRHDATNATRRDATEHDMILTVEDAAVVLGITAGAVRKRIARGQMAARKHRGQWRVILRETNATGHDATDATDTTRHDTTDATGQTRQRDSIAVPAPAPQVEAVNAMIARAVAEAVAPIERQNIALLERVASLAHENGKLEERLTTAMRDLDAALARNQTPPLHAPEPPVDSEITLPAPSFWSRLFGGRSRKHAAA
jgi:hypothetical protein